MTTKVILYDTTLRDGAQREGISFSVEDKVKIARSLDELGIHYIEGGWPGSNPKDSEFFAKARHLHLSTAKLAAFGSTRRPHIRAEDDGQLRALLAAKTPTITLVGKSWDFQARKVLSTSLEENLHMIADSIAFLKAQGREVFFDAEHFFDGYRSNQDYAVSCLLAAEKAGADCLVLCDTNGGTLSQQIAAVVAEVKKRVSVPLGIHAHNDAEVAVANTLAAVEQGVVQVQGTINGYGERCGNANLCSIIPNLKLKMGIDCISDEQLQKLTEISRYVSEVANLIHDSHLPYVGESAFAHKAGLHVDAVMKATEAYEHVPCQVVGNERRILISELAGKSNILYKVQRFGVDLTGQTAEVRDLVERIKDLESKGFRFEDAEASFELLVRRAQPDYQPPFQLLDLLVLVEQRKGSDILAEATVKIKVRDETMHTAAEGNGPVNALDRAMRKALLQSYPEVARIRLVDYKVRVLDDRQGTGATVRVSIQSTDGQETWNTVGSSTNIIEASMYALVDSLEYPLVKWGRYES
ncbi:MAG: citramalate synthase [Chloroflexi bacterium]|nr:citramalate synthase [Chloroflexota bacterium]MCL5076347.1 citramalate synthase [Chloroflexota bacterium]